ncbi:MAG: PQQ-dependent sugar dehydrogenase [Bythopirellula sp.]|nr:PQQ-dependent sugar dehydrogenase [Bythopirellula sp.]
MIRASLTRIALGQLSILSAVLLAISCGLVAAQAQSIQLGNLEATLTRPVYNAVSTNLRFPTALNGPNGNSGDFFVTGLQGRIHKFVNGVEQSATPFLNFTSEVLVNGGTGMLGTAFHPGYSNPTDPGYRKLYTYHSTALNNGPIIFSIPGESISHYNVLTEWQASAANPNVIDVSTRRELYREAHPFNNEHNGGALDFGADGYLYITTGTPPGTEVLAQTTDNILGKVLRIDPLAPAVTPSSLDPVSTNGQYRVPAANPFVATPSAIDEIYAVGLRNPYRMSVDPVSGLVFAGDVGQVMREEVSVFSAGANLGWPYREGSLDGPVEPDPPIPVMMNPIAEYGRTDGRSITGGFVYRGTSIPELVGKYVFGEFSFGTGPFGSSPGRLFWLDPYNDQGNLRDPADVEIFEFRFSASTQVLFDQFSTPKPALDITLYSFGVDDAGEIYIMGEEANKLTIYKIQSVLIRGDFDNDLDVDSDDLVEWKNDYGVDGDSDADGDGDGDSDGRDFLIWQQNVGFGLEEGLVATVAVPEPATCLLACAVLGSFICNRPRRLVA